MPFSRRSLLRTGSALSVVAAGGAIWRAWEQDVFSPAAGAGYEGWQTWRGDPAEGPLRFVRAAILAANPHNTQPWRFRVTAAALDLHADPARNLGAIDPFRREMFVGLGCALENLVLAARADGYRAAVRLVPDPADPTRVASVQLSESPRQAPTAEETGLYRAIPFRHTHRGAYRRDAPVDAAQLDALAALGRDMPAVTVRWLVQPEAREAFARQAARAAEAVVADAEQSRDSARWFRNSAREVHRLRDGVTLDAQALPPALAAAAKLLPAVSQSTADRAWLDATRDVQLATAPAFGILAVRDRDDPVQRLTAGRAWQRMHLWATREGLAMQPLNQLAERADRERQIGLKPEFGAALRDLLGSSEWQALMPFRLGHPAGSVFPSPRRDVREVVME